MWFVLQCILGVAAALLVWMLLVAVAVTHLEDRRRRRHGHSGRL